MSKVKIISEYIFALNGGYCVYCPSNRFFNECIFESWGIFSEIPEFLLGNIRSRDAFRPIARVKIFDGLLTNITGCCQIFNI